MINAIKYFNKCRLAFTIFSYLLKRQSAWDSRKKLEHNIARKIVGTRSFKFRCSFLNVTVSKRNKHNSLTSLEID